MTYPRPAPGQIYPLTHWEVRFRRSGRVRTEIVTVKATSLIQAAKTAKNHLNKLINRVLARYRHEDVYVRLISVRELPEDQIKQEQSIWVKNTKRLLELSDEA